MGIFDVIKDAVEEGAHWIANQIGLGGSKSERHLSPDEWVKTLSNEEKYNRWNYVSYNENQADVQKEVSDIKQKGNNDILILIGVVGVIAGLTVIKRI